MKAGLGWLSGVATMALVFASVGQASAAVINPAYQYTSISSLSDSRAFTLGFEFSLSAPVTVNALGYTTVGFTSDQQVGIWNSSGTLLTSTTVSTSDPIVDNFAWASIKSLNLGAGTYTIGGTFTGGIFPNNASGVTSIAGYTYITDEYAEGSGLIFPTSSTTGDYGANGIAQADFSVGPASAVPEPLTLSIFGAGVLGAAVVRRRRKKA